MKTTGRRKNSNSSWSVAAPLSVPEAVTMLYIEPTDDMACREEGYRVFSSSHRFS